MSITNVQTDEEEVTAVRDFVNGVVRQLHYVAFSNV